MAILKYILRDTARLLRRHWGVSLLTLLTAAAVFFLVGASSLLALNIRNIAYRVQSDLVIQAYSGNSDSIMKAVEMLKSEPSIVSLIVVTPEQAMDELKARMGSQAKALTMVGSNPLPWCLQVKVREASMIPSVVRQLAQVSGLDDLVYARSLADRLVKISHTITQAALVILVISVLVSSLVLYNTIRIGVYSRRQEISVMMLVGATRTYVASPFVFQGMLLGLLGSLMAIGMLHFGYGTVIDCVDEMLPFLHIERDLHSLLLLDQLLLCAGVIVGWACSLFAVGRYVREAAKPL